MSSDEYALFMELLIYLHNISHVASKNNLRLHMNTINIEMDFIKIKIIYWEQKIKSPPK